MQGYGSVEESNYFTGIAYLSPTPYSAHLLPHDIPIYPYKGYLDEPLWNIMNTQGFGIADTGARITDYSCVMVGKQVSQNLAEIDTIKMRFLIVASHQGFELLKSRIKMFVCGNADRDTSGSVNLSDVITIANDYFGKGEETFRYLADVNGDCLLNLTDVIKLANYYFGKPVILTCTCGEQ